MAREYVRVRLREAKSMSGLRGGVGGSTSASQDRKETSGQGRKEGQFCLCPDVLQPIETSL